MSIELTTGAGFEVLPVTAKVIRCGCGDPDKHAGQVCPTPREIEDLGVVASPEDVHVDPGYVEKARELVAKVRLKRKS